jgi:sigma-B regulation protein RsbU (phosphoserine phosphatase)
MRLPFKSVAAAATALEPLHANTPAINGANLAAVYYGQRMGGDFYDFLRVSRNRVLFGLLDVAGLHRDNLAVLSETQRILRTRAPQLFQSEEMNEAEAMIELCLELNRTILRTGGGVRSCPAFIGCYQEDLGTVCYFNAGHTPGLLRHQTGVTELPATGLPLGLFSHATCDAPTVAVEPSAVFLLVSRGVVEATWSGEEFGLSRAIGTLQQNSAQDAKEVCVHIVEGIRQFMRTPPTHNDVTALALARDPARGHAS